MKLIDSHSHFDVAEFDADRADALRRAQAAGVLRQVVPAVDAASWPMLKAVCAAHQGLHPAYGLHPMYLAHHAPEHLDALPGWIARERPVAVGECGLDFYVGAASAPIAAARGERPWMAAALRSEEAAPTTPLDASAQRYYFHRQLEIAREFDLPLILHARRALDEVTAALRRIGGLRGVVHSFSGSEEQAQQLWKLGFRLGIGGPVTYGRARRLRRVVAGVPIEQLLLETDSPDQPDAAWRGRRNEPARLAEVLKTVAALRGESEEKVAEATTRNAEDLFGLPTAGGL